ncbi:hypothetical protein [Oxalobacter formigenes]
MNSRSLTVGFTLSICSSPAIKPEEKTGSFMIAIVDGSCQFSCPFPDQLKPS